MEKRAIPCSCRAAGAARLPRRAFLGALGGISGLLLWPGQAWAKKIALKLEKVPALKKVGGWTMAKIKGEQLMLIRDGDASAKALRPVCTHKRALLKYNPKTRRLECPQHGSRYDLKGKVLKGPADRPLSSFLPAQLDLAKQRLILTLK